MWVSRGSSGGACVDLSNTLNLGDIYQVIPAPSSSLAHHGGEIAYLYNHYGQASLSDDQAAALQIAVWELLIDSVPDLSADVYQYSQTPAIVALANNFLAEAAGQDELAMVLDGSASQRQGIIATEMAKTPAMSVRITLDIVGDTSTSWTCGFYPWTVTTSNAQSPAFCDTCPPAGVRIRPLAMGCLAASPAVPTDRFLQFLEDFNSWRTRRIAFYQGRY
jgi:hypothetical protein